MKLRWSMFCSRSIIEQGTNSISLIGHIEQVALGAAVALEGRTLEDELAEHDVVPLPMTFELVTYWSRSDRDVGEQCEARLKFFAPNGKAVAEGAVDVKLTGETINRRSILKLTTLPFAGFGAYRMAVFGREKGAKRWRKYTDVPLWVADNRGADDEG